MKRKKKIKEVKPFIQIKKFIEQDFSNWLDEVKELFDSYEVKCLTNTEYYPLICGAKRFYQEAYKNFMTKLSKTGNEEEIISALIMLSNENSRLLNHFDSANKKNQIFINDGVFIELYGFFFVEMEMFINQTLCENFNICDMVIKTEDDCEKTINLKAQEIAFNITSSTENIKPYIKTITTGYINGRTQEVIQKERIIVFGDLDNFEIINGDLSGQAEKEFVK